MRIILLLFCQILFCTIVFAQTRSTVSGFVRDAETGENLLGAAIIDQTSGKGITANFYGFYSLNLPKGPTQLYVSYIGYTPQVVSFDLRQDTTINIVLSTNQLLDEVVVEAGKDETIEKVTQMSAIELPVAQMKALPAIGGEVDIMRVLQLLPGVKAGSEGNTGLYVRGGSPDQNLILLDGVTLYNVSHLAGFFSVFNADALANVQLLKGGYPARYGGRLSSVLDIKMKEGNNQAFHGAGSLGLIAARLSLEGPLAKGKGSYIVSGRRSYFDLFSRPISRSASDGQGTFGYAFYDLNGKANYSLSEKDKVYLSFYAGDDRNRILTKNDGSSPNYRYSEEGDNLFAWGNLLAALRWNHVFSPKLFSNVTANFLRYRMVFRFEQDREEVENGQTSRENIFFEYNSRIEDLNLRADFDYFPHANHLVKFGGSVIGHRFAPGVTALRTNYSQENSRLDTTFGSQNIRAVEASLYVEDDWEISPQLKVNAGLHLASFFVENTRYASLQPRMAVRYLAAPSLSLKASYATMQQFVHLLTNNDAGLPTDLWVPATEKVKPQFSEQIAFGIAKNLKNNTYEVSLETYYKRMDNLIEYQEGASFLGNSSDWQENVEIDGKGTSYGVELFLHKKTGRLNGWIGYTWSKTTRRFDNINFGKEYPYKYDRRHDLSIVANYQLTPKIDISGSWVFGTGNAVTLAVARFQSDTGVENGWDPDVEYYGGRNQFRMRSYHRLDAGIRFHKQKKWGQRTWVVGVYNAYSRANPFYYFFETQYPSEKRVLKQMSLFPIIPSVSYEFKF